MEILHVCHQFAPETRGGVENYVLDLAQAQRSAGQDAQVLCGSHVVRLAPGIERTEAGGVPVHRLHRDDFYFDLYSKAWHPGVEPLLRDFLRAHRPRVVHVHHWIRLTSNLVEIMQQEGIATVVTLHDHYASCPRAFRLRTSGEACFRPLSADSCRDCVPRYGHERREEIDAGIELFAAQSRAELVMADAVLVGVPETGALIASALGLPIDRFTAVGLGYRRRFPGLPQLPPPEPEAPLRFAFWGGIAEHKGIRVLLDACRQLAVRPPRPFELHVLGGFATPGLEGELREGACGLPVIFHGPFLTEALRTVQPAVGVFPSTCLETFGIVLDECFELGLPCITSDRGALGARAGAGGLRVPAGDAPALAAAMRRFLAEPGLWAAMQRRLPPLPPGLDEHRQALDAVYAAAQERRATAGPPVGGIPLAARAALLHAQRESALARLPAGERL